MKKIARLTSSQVGVFLSPGFLTALGVLLLNDFYLKAAFQNEVTGKLSDFAGLFAVSLAISALIPRRIVFTNICLFLAFVIWKTPLVDTLIESWNSMGLFVIARTVDYTDFVALVVLPCAMAYFYSIPNPDGQHIGRFRKQVAGLVIVMSVFAFTATTLVSDRNLTLSKGYAVRDKTTQIEAVLRNNPSVSQIKVTDEGDPPVDGSNTGDKARVTFFDFLIAEKTCDSDATAMSIMTREYASVTNIESVSISFTCREYESNKNVDGLNQQYLQHGATLFERDILKDLHILGSK